MPGLKEWKTAAPAQRVKVLRTIERLADEGRCDNVERFKHERNGIFAIKAWQIRLYCFWSNDKRLVLTNVVTDKKQDKARVSDLDRAERIRSECVNG